MRFYELVIAVIGVLPFGMLIAYLKEAYPEALETTEELNLGELSTFYRQAKKKI